MSDYFKWFPTITYNNFNSINITRRSKIFEDIKDNPYLFVPYTVTHDDRPEDIAYYYYGDPSKVWLVYLANNIIDPYTQWPMNYNNFQNFLIKKYQAQANTTGYGVISWTQSNIKEYQNNSNTDITITPTTYSMPNTNIQTSDWTPVSYYDYENNVNEKNRNIWLVNTSYLGQIEQKLQASLNGS